MHAIGVGHHGALARGIWVWLEDLDAFRHDAVRADRRRVVLDLRSGSVAQDPLMNEREVTNVEEVLDNSRRTCPHSVWPRHQHGMRRIVEQLEPWDLVSAAAKTHPYDAIGLRGVI